MAELLGPVKTECACGCGLYGTPRKNPEGHIRSCNCRRCLGQRNRRKGLNKQRAARKRLGAGPSTKFGDGNEENWSDRLFANEVKAGHQIRPATTAWTRIETQVLRNQAAIGAIRKPCRAVLMPDDWGTEGLVMVRLSTWEDLIRPALEQMYGAE